MTVNPDATINGGCPTCGAAPAWIKDRSDLNVTESVDSYKGTHVCTACGCELYGGED